MQTRRAAGPGALRKGRVAATRKPRAGQVEGRRRVPLRRLASRPRLGGRSVIPRHPSATRPCFPPAAPATAANAGRGLLSPKPGAFRAARRRCPDRPGATLLEGGHMRRASIVAENQPLVGTQADWPCPAAGWAAARPAAPAGCAAPTQGTFTQPARVLGILAGPTGTTHTSADRRATPRTTRDPECPECEMVIDLRAAGHPLPSWVERKLIERLGKAPVGQPPGGTLQGPRAAEALASRRTLRSALLAPLSCTRGERWASRVTLAPEDDCSGANAPAFASIRNPECDSRPALARPILSGKSHGWMRQRKAVGRAARRCRHPALAPREVAPGADPAAAVAGGRGARPPSVRDCSSPPSTSMPRFPLCHPVSRAVQPLCVSRGIQQFSHS